MWGIGIPDRRTSQETYDPLLIKWCKSLIYIGISVRSVQNDHTIRYNSALLDFSTPLPAIHLEKEYLLFYHNLEPLFPLIFGHIHPRCILIPSEVPTRGVSSQLPFVRSMDLLYIVVSLVKLNHDIVFVQIVSVVGPNVDYDAT